MSSTGSRSYRCARNMAFALCATPSQNLCHPEQCTPGAHRAAMRDGVSVAKDLLLPWRCTLRQRDPIRLNQFRNIPQSRGVYISTVVPMGMNGGP